MTLGVRTVAKTYDADAEKSKLSDVIVEPVVPVLLFVCVEDDLSDLMF